jgi:hypothetical protein
MGSTSGSTLKVAAAEGVTVSITIEDVDAEKFCDATYDAVMEWVPTASPALITALPFDNAAVPICAVASKNATVPGGTPPIDVTCAVNVAVFPAVTCVVELESAVVVAAGETVIGNDAETEPA